MNKDNYILIVISLFLGYLLYSNMRENNVYLKIELSKKQKLHSDSLDYLIKNLTTIEKNKRQVVIKYDDVNNRISERFEDPYSPTIKDSVDCPELLSELNKSDNLLLEHQKISLELNKSHISHLENLNGQLRQKDGLLEVNEEVIKNLKKSRGFYITAEAGGNENQFSNLSLGADYIFKNKPLLIGTNYNFMNKTVNFRVGIKPFK